MAKLTLPKKAVNLDTTGKKKSKWHLLKMNGYSPGEMTVCGYIVRNEDDDFWGKAHPTKPISEIQASQLCQKCLGAIKADD